MTVKKYRKCSVYHRFTDKHLDKEVALFAEQICSTASQEDIFILYTSWNADANSEEYTWKACRPDALKREYH